MDVEVVIDSEVHSLGVYVLYFTARDLVQKYDEELLKYIDECVRYVKSNLDINKLKDSPFIRPFRDLYWKLGIDPTKVRPAHEALIRRILRGSELPKINPVVDLGNAVSIRYMLPIGIYDLDRLGSSKLILRKARDGEEVNLLGSEKPVKLDNRYIVLATESGKIVHVYPHRDCQETSVTENTKNILCIVGSVKPIQEKYVHQATSELRDKITTFFKPQKISDINIAKGI